MFFDSTAVDEKNLNREILEGLKAKGQLETGDLVLLTRGAALGNDGGTNSMQVLMVD